jgi:signal transduction histidine kinase
VPLFASAGAEVVTVGQSRSFPIVSDTVSAANLAIVQRLGIRSALIVPLMLGARALGTLTLCLTRGRLRREGDVALAEELGRRTATAIEHARLYEHARAAVALREQTLAIVSHDLRSPLATIVMAASILGDDDLTRNTPRSRVLAAEKIQSATERMDRMIEDLLDFASIEAGRLSMTTRPYQAATIIADSVASFDALATRQRVTLTGVTAPELPAILCDRDRILQVIANLVGNALKSVVAGDSVCLSVTRTEREAVFSVADTGRGISHADQKRLFERYWRSPDARYKGSGLGLAIARGLVEAHRGRLWVESEPNHGATFFFTVPLVTPVA